MLCDSTGDIIDNRLYGFVPFAITEELMAGTLQPQDRLFGRISSNPVVQDACTFGSHRIFPSAMDDQNRNIDAIKQWRTFFDQIEK